MFIHPASTESKKTVIAIQQSEPDFRFARVHVRYKCAGANEEAPETPHKNSLALSSKMGQLFAGAKGHAFLTILSVRPHDNTPGDTQPLSWQWLNCSLVCCLLHAGFFSM